MIMPSLLFAGVLVFFLGFEVFGLPLVLGDPEGYLVLATYMYKLTNKLGTPSYHLMAAVAMCIVMVTLPLVMLQRRLLKSRQPYVTIKGKGGRRRCCRWAAGNGWPSASAGAGCSSRVRAALGHRAALVRHHWGEGVSSSSTC
jgi:iron(III) transport system permease protein